MYFIILVFFFREFNLIVKVFIIGGKRVNKNKGKMYYFILRSVYFLKEKIVEVELEKLYRDILFLFVRL